MPQFWIAIFFVLLAIAQLYQSIKDVELPFPVYLILGAALAVAANDRPKLFGGQDRQVQAPDPQTQVSPSDSLSRSGSITINSEIKNTLSSDR
jgi:hypothetical protein